jgi:hypothetical protein
MVFQTFLGSDFFAPAPLPLPLSVTWVNIGLHCTQKLLTSILTFDSQNIMSLAHISFITLVWIKCCLQWQTQTYGSNWHKDEKYCRTGQYTYMDIKEEDKESKIVLHLTAAYSCRIGTIWQNHVVSISSIYIVLTHFCCWVNVLFFSNKNERRYNYGGRWRRTSFSVKNTSVNTAHLLEEQWTLCECRKHLNC